MLFALICTDKPNSVDLRMKVRPDHLAFLGSVKTRFAGPFTDEAGSPTGSLVVIDAESFADAQAIAARDPYARAGLFQSVEIRPWKLAINNPDIA
jgi:uncharacterized protein